MKTAFMLLARYDGLPIIPIETICADYFSHLTPEKFMRKVALREIDLPVVRMEESKRSARGVHVNDLAAFLDRQTEAARRELKPA